jgi:cyclophilin family peptidyl-prolyl cis-trans isomerase
MKQLGTIDVELFEQDKPVTVSNFVAYIKAGLWHDDIMHRWVTNFVIQGGSYNVPFSPTNASLNVSPASISTFPAITNEYFVGRQFSNLYGTIAMARLGGQTNSATSSWFFNVADNAFLDSVDGGFTVFGRTLRGTNTLNRFKLPEGTTNLYFLRSQTGARTEVPVYAEDAVNAYWLNVDVTVLTTRIIRSRLGGVQISWDSVEGKTNIVEYTTIYPPVWQTLKSELGTGGIIGVTDQNTSDAMRQYRVRVDYSN